MTPICLITPPSIFLLDERVFVSLGILRVAAVLRDAGYPVEHLDLSGVENFVDAVEAHVSRSEATVYGLTATTPQMPAVTRIVEALNRVKPDARLILGGPHVTLVNAAYRREIKRGSMGRAATAMGRLESMFDVLVAGDGEDAVFHALMPDAPKLIDADDAASQLFMTDKRYDEMPFPARELVDMASYHYSIDGFPSTSLIGQLGCLKAGTRITMADGSQRAIETIREGDYVACFDEASKGFKTAPVAKTWRRQAQDMWRLTANDNSELFITSEHPVWTPKGWKTVGELSEGDQIATVASGGYVPAMRQYVLGDNGSCDHGQILRSSVSLGVAEVERQPEMASCGTARDEGQMGCNDAGGTGRFLQYRTTEGSSGDTAMSEVDFRKQEGRPQSDEAVRSSAVRIGYDEGALGRETVGADKEAVGRGQDANSLQIRDEANTEWCGTGTISVTHRGGTAVLLRRKPGVLDRSLRVWYVPKSRLHRQSEQESYLATWRVLAHAGECGSGSEGLRIARLGGPHPVVERTPSQEAQATPPAAQGLYFATVTGKQFIGPSEVFNITVCPGHSYIANGIVVHNCPYMCTFCGGRNSAMLRRIRNRSTENILREVSDLHKQYGFTGFMFYDDELNVSRSMVDLMNGIADLQTVYSTEFRLRGFIKSNLFADEQAEAMKRAGFRWILVGFESGSPRILENIQKKATQEQNSRCMEIARRHGLKVKALMSIGHAGESAETVQQTKDWLLDERPDDFDCTVISTYAGTPYFDEAVESLSGIWTYTAPKSGDRLHAYDVDFNQEAEYYKGVPGEYRSYVFTDHLSAEDLVRLRDDLENDVRARLGIPFNAGAPGVRFEASMGQLPGYILRKSAVEVAA